MRAKQSPLQNHWAVMCKFAGFAKQSEEEIAELMRATSQRVSLRRDQPYRQSYIDASQ